MSTVIDVCHCKSTNNLANHQINGQIILELVYYLYLCTRKTYRWFDKRIVIDNEKYQAKKGESFYIACDKPHYLENTTNKPAKAIWISAPPSF